MLARWVERYAHVRQIPAHAQGAQATEEASRLGGSGYRVQDNHCWQRTRLRRRGPVEALTGHMKNKRLLDRNWLRGSLGDAVHVLLCAAGQNLHLILQALEDFFACMPGPASVAEQIRITSNPSFCDLEQQQQVIKKTPTQGGGQQYGWILLQQAASPRLFQRCLDHPQ